MKIVTIIIRQPLERLPPIINLIDCLIILNYKINLICDESSIFLKEKYSKNVIFSIINQKQLNIPFLGKLLNWLSFRKKVYALLKNNKSLYSDDTILWIGSADAALPLMIGNKLTKYKYIFQCHELYDAFPSYIQRLKAVMQNAVINVGPESNRNAIYRSWYNLKETPITLPNKPYFHYKLRNRPINDTTAKEIIDKIKDKKILLYQGGIVKERDVTTIAKAISRIGDEWVLVLMGNTDQSSYLSDLLKQYPKTIHIPPIKAPLHLEITSWARIGIVSYSFDDLNHVFCAPNKTWEYTGFGIPLLGNNVPGIMNDILHFKSGEVLNFQNNNIQEVINAIDRIDSNYEFYSKNATIFFESIDIVSTTENILNEVKNRLQ